MSICLAPIKIDPHFHRGLSFWILIVFLVAGPPFDTNISVAKMPNKLKKFIFTVEFFLRNVFDLNQFCLEEALISI